MQISINYCNRSWLLWFANVLLMWVYMLTEKTCWKECAFHFRWWRAWVSLGKWVIINSCMQSQDQQLIKVVAIQFVVRADQSVYFGVEIMCNKVTKKKRENKALYVVFFFVGCMCQLRHTFPTYFWMFTFNFSFFFLFFFVKLRKVLPWKALYWHTTFSKCFIDFDRKQLMRTKNCKQ